MAKQKGSKNVDEMTDEELDQMSEQENDETVDQETSTDKEPESDKPESDEEILGGLLKKTAPVIEKQEKSEKHSAEDGLRKDLIGERERRRKAEEELQFLKGQLTEIQKQRGLNTKETEKRSDESDELSDDDIVPYKVVKSIVKETQQLRKEIESHKAAIAEERRRSHEGKIADHEKELRTKYSAETVGEEYAYDTILANEIVPMLRDNPDMAKAIRKAPNPAEFAYRVALANKLNLEGIGKKKVEIPAKPQGKPAPKTLGSAAAGGGMSAEISLNNLDEATIADLSDKELDTLLRHMKKNGT